MAIGFIGSTSGAFGASSSASVGYSASAASGDLVLVMLIHSASSVTATPVGGYSLLFSDVFSGGSLNAKWSCFYRILDGSSNDNANVNFSSGVNGYAYVTHVYRNAGDISVSTVATGSNSSPNPTAVSPSYIGEEPGEVFTVATYAACDPFDIFNPHLDNSGFPSGYSSGQLYTFIDDFTNTLLVSVASKSGSSTDDPGPFATTVSTEWKARSIQLKLGSAPPPVSGSGSAVERTDSRSASGAVSASGTTAYSANNDQPSSAGTVVATGSSSSQSREDTASLAGTATNVGISASQASQDTSGSAGEAISVGASSSQAGQDTAAFAGTATNPGTSASQAGQDAASSAGEVTCAGATAITSTSDQLEATAQLASSGSISAETSSDTSVSTGAQEATGSLSRTESPSESSATASLEASGSAATTGGGDTQIAVGVATATGSSTCAEQVDAASNTASSTVSGQAAASETSDINAASGTPVVSGQSAIWHQGDTTSSSGQLVNQGQGSSTNTSDAVSSSGQFTTSGAASPAAVGSSTSASGELVAVGSAAASETHDAALASEGVQGALTIVAEPGDTNDSAGEIYSPPSSWFGPGGDSCDEGCCPQPPCTEPPTVSCRKTTTGFEYTVENATYAWITETCGTTTNIIQIIPAGGPTLYLSEAPPEVAQSSGGTISANSNCTYCIHARNECGEVSCCDTCSPPHCELSIAQVNSDGSVTFNWRYCSIFGGGLCGCFNSDPITTATINGVSVLGSGPSAACGASGTITIAKADLPPIVYFTVANDCGNQTECSVVIPCCWNKNELRLTISDLDDINRTCSHTYNPPYNGTNQMMAFEGQIIISGISAANGTYIFDTNSSNCTVNPSEEYYIGTVDLSWYSKETVRGPRIFGGIITNALSYKLEITGAQMYVRPGGIFIRLPASGVITVTGNDIAFNTPIDPAYAAGVTLTTTPIRLGEFNYPGCPGGIGDGYLAVCGTDSWITGVILPGPFGIPPCLHTTQAFLPVGDCAITSYELFQVESEYIA